MTDPIFVSEGSPAARELRTRLDAFYRRAPDYPAFVEASSHADCWRYVLARAREIVGRNGACRILEVGAGRSGFASALGELRGSVFYVAQDVVPRIRGWPEVKADDVHIGDLGSMTGEFDIIFSTYVFEHVTNPRAFLDSAISLLSPNDGSLFIFCPRYDMPFYLPRSLRNRPWTGRLRIGLHVCWRRMMTAMSRRPAFLIVANPAVFEVAWRPDVDAVHLVSSFDLRAYIGGRLHWRWLWREAESRHDWVVRNFLSLNIELRVRA